MTFWNALYLLSEDRANVNSIVDYYALTGVNFTLEMLLLAKSQGNFYSFIGVNFAQKN